LSASVTYDAFSSVVEEWNPPRSPWKELVRKFALQDEVTRMRSLSTGWSGYAGEPPNGQAIDASLQALELLHELGSLPTRAVPLADGGLALVLVSRPFYAAIEIYNEGEPVAAFSDRYARHAVWETALDERSLRAAVLRLRQLMYA
jgi:hypothetical protein